MLLDHVLLSVLIALITFEPLAFQLGPLGHHNLCMTALPVPHGFCVARLGSIVLGFPFCAMHAHALSVPFVPKNVVSCFLFQSCSRVFFACTSGAREVPTCAAYFWQFCFFASHAHVHAVLQAPGHLVASVRWRQVFMMFLFVQYMYWRRQCLDGLRLQCPLRQHNLSNAVCLSHGF